MDLIDEIDESKILSILELANSKEELEGLIKSAYKTFQKHKAIIACFVEKCEQKIKELELT